MAGQLDSGAHWRDSARGVRFFMLDGKTAFPMLLFLLHITMWTFVVAVCATIFFTILRHYGFTVNVFARRLRCLISGPRKSAIPWWEKRE